MNPGGLGYSPHGRHAAQNALRLGLTAPGQERASAHRPDSQGLGGPAAMAPEDRRPAGHHRLDRSSVSAGFRSVNDLDTACADCPFLRQYARLLHTRHTLMRWTPPHAAIGDPSFRARLGPKGLLGFLDQMAKTPFRARLGLPTPPTKDLLAEQQVVAEGPSPVAPTPRSYRHGP